MDHLTPQAVDVHREALAQQESLLGDNATVLGWLDRHCATPPASSHASQSTEQQRADPQRDDRQRAAQPRANSPRASPAARVTQRPDKVQRTVTGDNPAQAPDSIATTSIDFEHLGQQSQQLHARCPSLHQQRLELRNRYARHFKLLRDQDANNHKIEKLLRELDYAEHVGRMLGQGVEDSAQIMYVQERLVDALTEQSRLSEDLERAYFREDQTADMIGVDDDDDDDDDRGG